MSRDICLASPFNEYDTDIRVENDNLMITIFLSFFRLMMSHQGLNSLFPMEDISVMGIWELLPHLSMFRVSNERYKICSTFIYECVNAFTSITLWLML